MKRPWYAALERAVMEAHVSKHRQVTVGTDELLRLLGAVQDFDEVRRLCGVAATCVGREPDTTEGVQYAQRVKRKLRSVWREKP